VARGVFWRIGSLHVLGTLHEADGDICEPAMTLAVYRPIRAVLFRLLEEELRSVLVVVHSIECV
jgi:hypothetical protein